MSSFEGYHPLLTPSFRFDWLTQFKLKNVATLTSQDLATAADWVNATMHATMNRTALTWGIERRQTHKLMGWGGFTDLEIPAHRCALQVVGPKFTPTDQEEILRRLIAFGHDELQLTKLTLVDDHRLAQMALTAVGFQREDQQWIWRAQH